ncbi:hypothetical protein BKH42_08565 [Helicobacter sp. 13S00482-2]|uniref:relaxase/mobilization nuclease domain-containing protein n=1 Tax=Helicobacter sp. 13S00482-2 TaxID=1476200 RepID=UPI000BA5B106|nr:relaxase/mobilization nuclease domain-containing protein [Helicobacter sp. 13S00482-2]PAF52951.1 hypothetical protein BKH42_08565 [Helicobacter sp. 13S00482-2]
MAVIRRIPLNYKDDEPLFEFEPIKRIKAFNEYANNSNYSFVLFKKLKNYNLLNDSSHSKDDRKNIVIKNIGNLDQKHLRNALDYVLRNSEDKIAINEDFEFKTYKEVLLDWEEDFSNNESTKEAMHLVFSLKEPHSKIIMEILKKSVYETMRNNFREYQFVLIPHSHQNNPHIHCIVNKTNTWTRNKLRFAKKSDCREFFFKLKEDFKNEVYCNSGGKLDYKNDVRLKFDHLLKEFDTINEQSKKFNHRGFYSQSLKDLNKHHFRVKNNIVNLELKVIKLYKSQNNIGLNSLEIKNKIQILQNRIIKNNQKLKEIEDNMKKLLDWDQNFNNFTKSFNLFEKKKILYDSIVKMKPYASKTLFANLNLLEKHLKQEKNYIQEGLDDIYKGFDKNIFLNEKSNMFALNKKYRQLKNYGRMLKEIENSNSNEAISKAQIKEKEVLDLMNSRIKRLLGIYKSIHREAKEQEKKLQTFDQYPLKEVDEMLELASKHLRNLKALNFMGKELLLAKKILKDTEELKEINQNTHRITTRIKEIQKITQNMSKD